MQGYRPVIAALAVLLAAVATAWQAPAAAAETEAALKAPLPEAAVLRGWIAEMKASDRGPFRQIRWFCRDGTIQPPEEYACRDHGGGVQHGQWTERVERLRAHGYRVATVFADIDAELFVETADHPEAVCQMVVEQFLIAADDGWIFRRARYYRGALQAEDEAAAGRALLAALAGTGRMVGRDFLVLREAARFFPHGRPGAPLAEMRQLSRAIAEADPGFETLRVKLHVKPQPEDAAAVRAHAADRGRPELAEDYRRLAALVDEVFRHRDVTAQLSELAVTVRHRELARAMRQRVGQVRADNPPWVRFAAAARLMADLRRHLPQVPGGQRRLRLLDVGLDLEAELFRVAEALQAELAAAGRHTRLRWLQAAADALFGGGLLTGRQQAALADAFARLDRPELSLAEYRDGLDTLALVPAWADRNVRFHFSGAVGRFALIEPRARAYPHDRLRGSPLLFYTAVLDSLLADAGRLLGVRNRLFEQPVDAGLKALNPGLARGTLRADPTAAAAEAFDPQGIYVLPATREDLPPVAGILTAGEGNLLSHVQLLARSMGIPNVAVSEKLLPRIERHAGQAVVLAVSPGGVVELAADGPAWDKVFEQPADAGAPAGAAIRPEPAKLELADRRLYRLSELRAADAGRVCGPKAANLAELKHFFPEAVTGGIVIPFGVFRDVLAQPFEPGGPPIFEWMKARYRRLAALEAGSPAHREALSEVLAALRRRLQTADPGGDFRRRLAAAMTEAFGAEGTYGVFVRSDTNVEDLPGFTGAGLNKTVPHVVGFDNVLDAVRQVWASPFTERAFAWRQAHMESPEHVYVSVLLMKSVPVEKSGVMVTAELESGAPGWLSVAVSEGVGGAVAGQRAEQLRYHPQSGRLRSLSQATEPEKRVLADGGGIRRVPASGAEALLGEAELAALAEFARLLPQRFPPLRDAQGRPVPADVEFGFIGGRLVLFQIRPFLDSDLARKNLYLARMDAPLRAAAQRRVDMTGVPGREEAP